MDTFDYDLRGIGRFLFLTEVIFNNSKMERPSDSHRRSNGTSRYPRRYRSKLDQYGPAKLNMPSIITTKITEVRK